MPKRLRRRTNGMKNGAPDDGCVCHHNTMSVLTDALIKPRCGSSADVREQFATVRSRGYVRQPCRNYLRFLGLDIAQAATGPASVVAIAQSRIDGRR